MRNYEDQILFNGNFNSTISDAFICTKSEEPIVDLTDSLNDESNTDNGLMPLDANFVELTEEIKNGTSDAYGANTIYYDGKFYAKLTDALKAVYTSNTNDDNEEYVLYVKKNADVGTMTHGHVADNLTIHGNGAFVSGVERVLEFDTYKFIRNTGAEDKVKGNFITRDITVNVYNLDGIAA